MRINSKNVFAGNGLFKLKNQDWLDKQRVAGKIVADTLSFLQQRVLDKTTQTLQQLNDDAEDLIIKSGGLPTFKGYKGFPAGVCISVNKQLVHGIPSDYKLQEGDVISFDLGATVEEAIADSALTCIYGQPKSDLHIQLIKATENSLMKGIEAIAVGKRLGCIGHAISKCAKSSGFGIVVNYGGHGLDWDTPHAPPFVANRGNQDEGIRIQSGLAIAIEPMLTIGSAETKTLSDGWTVATDNVGCHFEHSVFVHDDHVEIITARN